MSPRLTGGLISSVSNGFELPSSGRPSWRCTSARLLCLWFEMCIMGWEGGDTYLSWPATMTPARWNAPWPRRRDLWLKIYARREIGRSGWSRAHPEGEINNGVNWAWHRRTSECVARLCPCRLIHHTPHACSQRTVYVWHYLGKPLWKSGEVCKLQGEAVNLDHVHPSCWHDRITPNLPFEADCCFSHYGVSSGSERAQQARAAPRPAVFCKIKGTWTPLRPNQCVFPHVSKVKTVPYCLLRGRLVDIWAWRE